jgi:hypothetical protein
MHFLSFLQKENIQGKKIKQCFPNGGIRVQCPKFLITYSLMPKENLFKKG